MNYIKIYNSIIEMRRTCPVEGYGEIHHIIPRCLGGSDEKLNKIKISAREHYILHWLLTSIYPGNTKLMYAFHMMHMDNEGRGRYRSSRGYQIARTMFSQFHPMKTEEGRNKVSASITDHYNSDAGIITKKKIADSVSRYYSQPEILAARDKNRSDKIIFDNELVKCECECACGCGIVFDKIRKSKKIYAHIVNREHKPVSLELRERLSKIKKESLSEMTPEELSSRSKNSFGSCDHVARGAAISASKKGVSTNQFELEIIKYGQMSDIEFSIFIAGRKSNIQSRMKNKREKYLCRQ